MPRTRPTSLAPSHTKTDELKNASGHIRTVPWMLGFDPTSTALCPSLPRRSTVSWLADNSRRVTGECVVRNPCSGGGFFGRFAFSIVWDFAEVNPFSGGTGDYGGAVEWIAKAAEHATKAT